MKAILYTILFLSSLLFACKNKNSNAGHKHNDQEAHTAVYTCPMHPEIVRDKPGSCPICGMELVKKEDKSVAIKDVSLDALLKPTSGFVLSSVPTTTMEESEEPASVTAYGTVTYDNRHMATVSSRIEGRIEKMYVRYRYQFINRGDKILDIYSPELVNSQQNLVFLLRSDPDNAPLINAAKQRLYLLGMSNQQVAQVVNTGKPFYSVSVYSNYSGYVNELNFSPSASPGGSMNASNQEMGGGGQTINTGGTGTSTLNYDQTTKELSVKEGMYLQKGQPILTVINPAKALALLNIFADQQGLVKKGDPVKITPEGNPAKAFSAKIDLIEPFYRPESKTLTARIYFSNTKRIPIGTQVQANVFPAATSANWLPSTAVITLGIDDVVFRKEGGGFRAHRITTSTRLNDKIQVVSGLAATDSVATNAQFLIGSESFIKTDR